MLVYQKFGQRTAIGPERTGWGNYFGTQQQNTSDLFMFKFILRVHTNYNFSFSFFLSKGTKT